MDSRPREERDFSEFYDNLNDTTQLDALVARVWNSAKISKALVTYGYRPPTKQRFRNNFCYARFQQTLPSHLLLVYDMDEQDTLYLDWMNQRQEKLKISPEIFEIAMSILESEWHKLEMRMVALVGPGHEGRDDLKMDANFEKYGSDDGTGGVGSLSEQRCAVCNDLECDNTNSIVYCDGCNIAVHQECYGVAFIPEGQWFCRSCMVNRGSSVSCAFCPSKTGAFKQLDNGMWSHVVCALWIREVYFANPVYLEPIEGVASIPRSRWTLVCYICKQKTGACIQCVHRKCTQAYHVTCAKRSGLHMVMDNGILGAIASNDTLKSYCDRHSPSFIDQEIALTGILRTRLFYKDAHYLSRKNDKLALERRQANRINRFKWRTENGTPIAPQIFVEVLVNAMKSLKVGENGPDRMLRGLVSKTDTTKDQEGEIKAVSAALCRYWCLKREAKKGAPLVRVRASDQDILEPDTGDPGLDCAEREEQETQMPEKIAFGYSLDRDLQKLVQLNSLVVERQKLISASDEETFKMTDTAFFAFRTVGLHVIQQMTQILQKNPELERDLAIAKDWAFEQIVIDISNGKLWSALEVDQRICLTLGERSYTYTPGSLTKAMRYWHHTGLQELITVEKSVSEPIPFAEIDGIEYSLKRYFPKAALEAEDLSEVEDDPFMQPANREILKRLVTK
ncbi:hypothetical protein METBIDRAFT_89138 [Metschnikowia bicuspidata var. bicuspidata NRRL YB-4993]|uniref:PHD-type domain-containing protein n=1 Tax=Metschnikowia bicuspidata var. bicuspidata NRRL YB-4993 TaxID=869754 RepID=A0A1A0H597_9ASCO|nr:hypothetical protein METBIDRAFT_89138 [Metschnikowia bicuspidata var. bicuspidata NRRL YB-4993]OBA19082.1 hypothetical protein METBIDRAFT_89138 [Metschnikowia bicuspidata var. bicuspidata NRRL YB-4993]